MKAPDSALVARVDSWSNALAGLGTERDKATHWRYQPRGASNDALLELFADAYAHDDVTQAVASRVADAMLSQGWEIWRGEERAMRIEETLLELGAEDELRDAKAWEDLLGGSAVLLGADDGRPLEEPLDDRAVRSLSFLRALDRRDVVPDTARPGILRLRFYRGDLTAHESRLLLFRGRRLPARERRLRQGWGVGVVEPAWDEIEQFHATWAAVRHLLVDSAQGVFRVAGVQDAVGAGLHDQLQERMRQVDQMRSVARSLVLDLAESFERQVASLTGYADVLDKAFERLAQAVAMPVTVLVGMSPAGLSATGESDVRLWYDRVARDRRRGVEPAVRRLARLAAVSLGEDPDGLTVVWPSLWQPTDEERATARKAEAEADQAEVAALQAQVDAGLLDGDEARTQWRRAHGLA